MFSGSMAMAFHKGTGRRVAWWTEPDRLILFAFVAGTGLLTAFNAQRIVGILMIVALCIGYQLREKNQMIPVRSYPPELIFYTLWALWSGLTGLFVSVNMQLFWLTYRVILQMAVMMWAIYGMIRLKPTPHVVFLGLFTSGVIQMIPAMMGITQVVESNPNVDAQITGIADNPNVLGFTVVLGALSGLIMWNLRTPYQLLQKSILFAVVVGSGYVAAISGSRKTVLIYGVLILIWAVFILPKGRGAKVVVQKVVAVSILVSLLVVVVPLVMQQTSFGTRWSQFVDEGGGDLKESWRSNLRYEMYKAGFDMFRSQPITGVGLGQFQALFVTGQYSHSDFVESLSTTGLVGMILYQGVYVLLIVRLRALIKLARDHAARYEYRTMLLAIVVIILFGLGGVHMNSQPIFTFLSALSAYTWTRLHEAKANMHLFAAGPALRGMPRVGVR
jgi:O-antigen ligase